MDWKRAAKRWKKAFESMKIERDHVALRLQVLSTEIDSVQQCAEKLLVQTSEETRINNEKRQDKS